MKNKIILPSIIVVLVTGLGLMFFLVPGLKNINKERADFISQKENIIGKLIVQGKYACCLSKPCTYCIEKTPGHGEGATCGCLKDVVTGKHPCGECIGEILEGHGNPFLAKYFASSIAEEVGEKYLKTLKDIISEKYGISIEEQI